MKAILLLIAALLLLGCTKKTTRVIYVNPCDSTCADKGDDRCEKNRHEREE